MFITCQECNTTFRLDERLLKPTGSKVRCSQCFHTFIAMPPQPHPVEPQTDPHPSTGPAATSSREAETEAHELEGIDLAELDAILEGNSPSAAAPVDETASLEGPHTESGAQMEDLDEIDLDIDFDAALDSADETPPAPPTAVGAPVPEETDADELDLNLDFELDDASTLPTEEPADLDLSSLSLDDELQPPETSAEDASSAAASDDDLDIALDGLDLASAQDDAAADTISPPDENRTDDFDLADFDLDLADGSRDKTPDGEEPELSLADELDPIAQESDAGGVADNQEAVSQDEDPGLGLDQFELELDDAPEAASEQSEEPALELDEASDDIDLSDLDALLESADAKMAEEPSEEPDLELDEEPALDLEMQDNSLEETSAGDSGEDELEELEFELDSEFEDNPAGNAIAAEASSEDDEIDLSDIEEMLGSDAPASAAAAAKTDHSDDADLGLSDDGEIDLSEIESAIDTAEEPNGGRDVDDVELELDLDLDSDESSQEADAENQLLPDLLSSQKEEDAEELDLALEMEFERGDKDADAEPSQVDDSELDLSDLADLVDEKATGKTEIVDSGDIELEFQIEEDAHDNAAPPAKAAAKMPAVPIDETMETLVVEEKPAAAPKHLKPKQKSSKSLVLLLLLLLAAAGGGLYYAVTQMGIQIPYLSDYLNPQPADPNGILNLSTLDINSKFIENEQAGRLFVITGKVRNGYGVPRAAVRLQGKLFTKGKVLVKTEYSYAGNVIDDQALATLTIAEIKQRLNKSASGAVRAGQTVPFMLIFAELPPADQLDEFAIEPINSAPGA